MDFEEAHRLGLLGYDERTETWYVQGREPNRLMLTRQSLGSLVQMYNSIHTGSRLALLDARELRRIEDAHALQSESLREANLALDRGRRSDPLAFLRRVARRIARWSDGRR